MKPPVFRGFRTSAWTKWMRCQVVALAALCAACGQTEVADVRQVGDTTFVHSAEPARDTATLRELLRIGVLEGAPEYMFRDLANIAVGPRGYVFIAQLDGDLRQYDAEGAFVRTVARVGQGPGEIEYVVGMDVAPDGRLALVDFGNQRVSVYDREGRFLRQIRRPAGRPGYGRDAIRWDENGDLWISIHPPRRGPDTLAVGDARPLYGRLVGDGTVVDTAFLPTRAWTGCERRRIEYAGGFFEDGRIPYLPFAQWSRGRDGSLAFGCSAAFSFDVVGPDGRVTRMSRPWEPARMSDEEHAFRAEYMPWDVPGERPAFLRLWLADDGRVWAWRGAAGRSFEVGAEDQARGAPPVVWDYWAPTDGFDVFDPDGIWVGYVRTPESWGSNPYPGNRDPQFVGDTVWAVTKDEFDASYVSKFVVEWPSG